MQLKEGLPFIDLHVVSAEEFDFFVGTIFGNDRLMVHKGVIEVPL
jgi:hypothetical protein